MVQHITIFVNDDGIIENPTEPIVENEVVIIIDEHNLDEIKNAEKEIVFCDGFSQSENFEKLTIIDRVGVKKIGDNFLFNHNDMIQINFIGFTRLTTIGNNFLLGCYRLESFDFSTLPNITNIGGDFLSNCHSLSVIDLSPILDIDSIGGGFLSDCEGISSIILLPPQKYILLEMENNKQLEMFFEIDMNWYNTPNGKKYMIKKIMENNNIKNVGLLLDFVDFL
jgi:hypothetical protein